MSRTFINQSTQIGGSESYDDSLTPGSELENQETLQGDLNALRTILKQVVNPQGNWYDQPSTSLAGLASDVSSQATDIAALQTTVGDLETDVGVAIESLQASVETLEGNVSTIQTTLATQAGEIQAVQTNVATLQSQAATAEQDISALESDLGTLQTTVASQGGDIAVLQANVSTLTTEQGNLGITVAQNVADIVQLGNDIVGEAALREQADSALDGRLTTAEGEIDTLQSGLSTAEGNISVVQSDMSVLQTGLGTAQANITTLQGDVQTVQGSISTLQSDVLTAQGNIISLQVDVSAIQSDLSGKVSNAGDTMTGTLSITSDAVPGLLITSSSAQAIQVFSDLGSQPFFEVNAGDLGLNLTDGMDMDGDGKSVVLTREQLSMTVPDSNGGQLAWTNILSGEISLMQGGSATIPTAPEHATTKAYVDGEISTLSGSISTLDAAVIKKDGSVAFTGNQSLGNNLLTDLGTPVSALDAANKAYVDAVATGLVIKAPVAAKYDFQGGVQPDLPELPTEPPTTFLYTGTTYTVTDEGGLNNALGVAIDGDSIFIPANTTITLTSSKTISRSIQLYGVDSSSVLTASFAVSANSGLLIVAGKKSDNSQNNNVAIRKLAITSSSNTNDHACIVANTLSAEFPNGSTGLRFEDLTLNHTEFGITVAADSWKIKNCTFNYIPVTGASDTSRHLGIYNIGTMGWVEDCSFPATTEATPRTIAMLLSAANYVFTPGAEQSGGYSGDFVVKNCSQLSGNLRQWMVMEAFKANGLNSAPMAEHGFSMWLINNEHGNTSGGSHIFYEGTNRAPLNFFDVIYTSGNVIGESTSTDKGMLAIDGLGSARSAGAPTALYVDVANSGSAFTAGLGGTYVQGSDVDNLLAINSTYFNSPSPSALVTVETPVSGGPAIPAGFGVDVGGYVAQAGDRIFIVNSYDAVQSGIYIVALGEWVRADDYALGADVASTFFFVKQGDYADTSWVEVSDPAVVGANSLGYAQFSGPGTYTGTGAIDVSAQNVISIRESGISEAMLASSSVTEDKLAADSVSTLKISDSAVTTAKLEDLAVTTAKLADAAVTAEKLAFEVYTKSESNDLIADKLSLTGGLMSGDIMMGANSITGLADLTANSLDSAAANKKYVDEAVSGVQARGTKTFATVTAQNGLPADTNVTSASLSASLPDMSGGDFAADYDVFVNGQLQNPGSGNDYYAGDDLSLGQLKFKFALLFGDTICVVVYN